MSKRLLRYLVIVVLLLIAVIWSVNYMVVSTTKGQLYSDISKIPKNTVGLLLGTAKYQDKGRKIINPYYQNRIEAAVALYMAGKVDFVIVSGDNSTVFYNEPALMKEDLIALGIPADKIFMDSAGFRTLDSILRCRDIFGQGSFTIISQAFHNQRAIFIANHKQVTTVAFNARDGVSSWDVVVREKLARVKMVLDLVVNKQAKHYGAPIEVK